MTISSTIAKHQYKGNGNTFIFPFSFRIWNKKQILVTITNSEGITNTIMPYAVTFTQKGGEVTLYLDNEKKIPFPKGYSIALTRNMPFLQESDYINGTRINSEVFEDNLDIATAERQQLLERVLSAITVPPTSSQTPDELWNDFIGNVNFVKQALLAIQKAMANLFSQTIIPFTTKNNVLVYSVGEDIVLDPDANNLLLVMDHVVQQPDVAYFIKNNNSIQFKVNPGEGKKVWGISSLSFANPDIRAIVEKAIATIKAEGEIQKEIVTTEGNTQVAILKVEGAKWANLSKAWAESPTPPDPKDPQSKSAKEWAKIASGTVPIATYDITGKVKIDKNTLSIDTLGLLSIKNTIINTVNNNSQIIEQHSQKIETNLQAITNLQNNKIDKSAISSDLNVSTEINVASSKAVNDLFKLIKGENVPEFPDISGGGIVKEIARRYKAETDGAWTLDVIPYKPVYITANILINNANTTCFLRIMSGADTTTAPNVDAYNYGGVIGKANGVYAEYTMVLIPTNSSLTLKTYGLHTFKDGEYLIAYQ